MKLITLLEAVLVGGALQVQAFSPSYTRSFVQSTVTNSRPTAASTCAQEKNDAIFYRSSQLFMGWGPDPIWQSGTITSNSAACPSKGSVCITMDVPDEVMEGYAIPGQYVQMKASIDDEDAKPIFLAIASAPPKEGDESNTMEFLIKKTDNNSWITSASESTSVAVSQVMGGGFNMKEKFDGVEEYDFPCQNVLLFANGSGIAPIRAAIESGQLKTNDGRSCRLYYGVTSPSDMPYADRFARWEQAGVAVVPVISRPEECKTEWPGRTGYVQNALEEDGVPIPRNTGALLCGVKGMAESVTELLGTAGVLEGRTLTNF